LPCLALPCLALRDNIDAFAIVVMLRTITCAASHA
jgi:hypothetical protein